MKPLVFIRNPSITFLPDTYITWQILAILEAPQQASLLHANEARGYTFPRECEPL